jgi:endo-1,4-beta-xylanase
MRPFSISALLAGTLCVLLGFVPSEKGLKDYYADYFTMGVAVAPRSLSGPDSALILRHFGSLTAENAMKMGPIHPEPNRYFWTDADAIAGFARRHGLKMRGHTLCWHQQTPPWFFVDEAGKQVSKEVLLQRLKAHIETVVGRYKGQIYAWDVVNEAIDDNDSKFWRESSPFYQIAGEEYIAKAFEYAHAADPDALLFYNDYNTENPGKRERIFTLMKRLKEQGVPIHGVGLQGHWSIYGPKAIEIERSIERFASLGLDVHVTELDVSVYRSESDRRDKRPDEADTFTSEMEQSQYDFYMAAFAAFRNQRYRLSNVTFWNVTDRRSWLDNFPVRGRKNYPLLFDTNGQPKRAYTGVVTF